MMRKAPSADSEPPGVLRSDATPVGSIRWIDGPVRVIGEVSLWLARIAGIATLGMMLHIAFDVFGRWLFNSPVPGTLEMVTFSWMPIIVFLGLPYALRENEHLRMTLVLDALPDAMKPQGSRVAMTGIATAAFVVGWYLWVEANSSFAIGETDITSSIDVLIWPTKYVAAIGATHLFIQAIALLAVPQQPDHR